MPAPETEPDVLVRLDWPPGLAPGRRPRGLVVRETPSADARRATPKLAKVVWGSGYPAFRADMGQPFSKAVLGVAQEAAAGRAVAIPTSGGSIPMYVFPEIFGGPLVGLPIANHDDNQHAANENLRLQNLWDGIELYAALYARLGAVWK
jgi:acetylornithine deacetylase/succinyl-diaminopimelate desuccinylase-like protein